VKSAPEEAISKAIEFARLADMCDVTTVESLIAKRIKDVILASPLQRITNTLVGELQTETLITSRPSTSLQCSICAKDIQCAPL
jgi:hypothetical protein